MADNEIDIRIDNKQVLSALEQINKRLEDFGKTSQKNISRFEKAAKDSFSSVSKSLKDLKSPLDTISGVMQGLGVVALGALGVKAFKAVASQFDTVVDAAVRQENALNQLRFAMARTGEFTNEAFKDMQQFASALQDTTGVGDEATLEMLSLAKSFGASNKQAKLLTEAAIELSAATGKSTNEAIRQVSKTLGGFAGELGEVNPKIKALTAEQLKAGEAARILLDQYGGSAANKLQTFSGALEAAKGRFSDLLEVIGDLIIKNPLLIELIGKAGDGFKLLGQFIKENSAGFGKFFTKGLAEAVKSFSALVVSFDVLGKAISKLSAIFVGETSVFTNISTVIGYITDETLALTQTILTLRKALNDPLGLSKIGFSFGITPEPGQDSSAELNEKLTKAIDEIIKLREQNVGAVGAITGEASLAEGAKAIDSALGNYAIELSKLANSFSEYDGSVKDNTSAVQNQTQATENASKSFQMPDKLLDFENITWPDFGSIIGASIANFDFGAIFEMPAKFLSDLYDKAKGIRPADIIDAAMTLKNSVGAFVETFASGVVGASLQGAEGARKLLVEGGAKAVDAFAPGAGEAAKPIIEALSQGPDFVRQQVREFVAALPMLIDNIAQAIPVLIEELAKNTDEIIIALVKGTPQIIRALVIEVPKQLTNPALWFDVAKSLGEALASEIVGGQVSFSAEKLNMILADIWLTFSGQVSSTLTELTSGFGRALSNALPAFALEFGVEIDQQAINFRNKIAEGLRVLGDQDQINKIGRRIGDGIREKLSELTATPKNLGVRLFNGFFNAFLDKANAMGQAIADGFSIDTGGGGEGLVPDSTPIIGGLAKGGTIPPGFNNDTFSAFLSSGELVVPRDDVDRLRGFLDQQETGTGNADNGLIAALLSQILTALNQPMTVTTQANINGKAFADIILKLNRNNARLTA